MSLVLIPEELFRSDCGVHKNIMKAPQVIRGDRYLLQKHFCEQKTERDNQLNGPAQDFLRHSTNFLLTPALQYVKPALFARSVHQAALSYYWLKFLDPSASPARVIAIYSIIADYYWITVIVIATGIYTWQST